MARDLSSFQDFPILQGLLHQGVSAKANDNIAHYLTADMISDMEYRVQSACQNLLNALAIDTESDHNTQETARRMAKMYIHEVFKGRYQPMPNLKDFPNVGNLDEIYLVGPITIRSGCSHHMVPIMGEAWVGVVPGDRLIGLSKFGRLADWIFSRPQIQEEATIQFADIIEEKIKPKGVAVIVKATHYCMSWRGVKEPESEMTTSVMRGVFREDPAARAEFLKLVSLKK